MKGKKIVSTLLVLLLLASLPVSALAAEWDISSGDITVNAGSGGQTVTQGDGAAREPNRSPAERVRFGKSVSKLNCEPNEVGRSLKGRRS